jgi:hypothetical protein
MRQGGRDLNYLRPVIWYGREAGKQHRLADNEEPWANLVRDASAHRAPAQVCDRYCNLLVILVILRLIVFAGRQTDSVKQLQRSGAD